MIKLDFAINAFITEVFSQMEQFKMKTLVPAINSVLRDVAVEANTLFKTLVTTRHRVQTGLWRDSNPVKAKNLEIDFTGNNKVGKLDFKNVGTEPFKNYGAYPNMDRLTDWAITKGIYQSEKDAWKVGKIAKGIYKGKTIGNSVVGVSGSNYDGTSKTVAERNIYDEVEEKVITDSNVEKKLTAKLTLD